MKKIKLLAAFLALIMLYGGLLTAQQTKKDKEIYEKAKKSIFQKDWDAAIKGFEAIVEEFKNSSSYCNNRTRCFLYGFTGGRCEI